MSTKRSVNINDIGVDEGYKMSMAEFKGATINALQYINKNIQDLQESNSSLQNQLNNQKLIAAVIGGVAGVISAIVTPFKKL